MEAKKILQSLRRRKEYFPYFIFFFGILVTFGVSIYLNITSHQEDLDRFANVSIRAKDGIHNRIDRYTTLLRAGSGLFAASEAVTKDEFKTFTDTLGLFQHYQGVQGIVYAARVTDENRELFVQEVAKAGVSNFSIRPLPANSSQNEQYVIIYFEPQGPQNNAAIGTDVFSEPMRRQAMVRARDSGKASVTSRLVLPQGKSFRKQSGFIIYVPVYANNNEADTIAERRENIEGFIYSPFRAQDLLGTIYKAEHSEDVRLRVYDGDAITADNLLYDSSPNNKDHVPRYTSAVPLDVAGRRWTLAFSSLPQFEQASESQFVPYILFFGILASSILFYITRLQIKARQEALSLAEDLYASQRALKDSNRQVSSIVESITDGFIALDRSFRFMYVNSEAARTLGRSPQQLIGKNLWDEFPEMHTINIGKTLARSMRVRRHFELEEFYTPSKQWLSIRMYPSRNGLSVYFQNITERIKLERQKDEFLGIASHELKTPVTSLKSYAQVLYRRFSKRGDSESALHLSKMDNQLDKLTLLISDLLDVTKVEAGKMIFTEAEFDLQLLVIEIVEELQRTTDQHVIKLQGKITKSVYGDKERIGQVISNLLSNAIKYSPEANRIVVSLSENKKEAIICVRDFGVGIPKKTVNKVFERFYRVSGPKQETFPGLGLGLYISSEIIKRQGGKIWVESEIGKGSNFCFSVPFVVKPTLKHV